jgi:hypothetical protein
MNEMMNELVCCPYNSSHKVKKFKLLAHIHKCKDQKKYQPGEILNCKADPSTRYSINEKRQHEANCGACKGQEIEQSNSPEEFTLFPEKTLTKLELNLGNTAMVDGLQIVPIEEFFKKIEEVEETVILQDDDSIIY